MTQQQNFLFNQSTGSINDFINPNLTNNSQQEDWSGSKSPETRRDTTKAVVDRLYQGTFIQQPGVRDVLRTGGRKNKNEILGLTLARLTKEKHLSGLTYSRDIELVRGIQMKSNNNSFVIILRTDGRIVAMSDEAENHLGKSMRSLYSQCINIFECLDKTDGGKLQSILNTSSVLTNEEHRLLCTFRLPKGKRPSRAREDIKAISMVGHFYSCHDSLSTTLHETLFIARCEALVSQTTNGSNSSQTSMMANNNDTTNSMIKITLNDDLSIHMISTNVKDILGYSRSEMIGHWLGRYLATNDVEKLIAIREQHFQEEQQVPTSTCDIFDMYVNNGDSRLTFLCQIRPIRERRSKSIKFFFLAQLIDSSLRSEYVKYVETESETSPKRIKAEQVNPGAQSSSSIPQTSEDTITANSPSLANGLLRFGNLEYNDFVYDQRPSPIHRSLSNLVAPVDIDAQCWPEFFDLEYNSFPATNEFQYESANYLKDAFIESQYEQQLANIFDEYLDGYYC